MDGGDVVAEYTDGERTASYLRGINLISSTTSNTKYYLHNAHGDVVALANSSGTVTKRYDYDAFGNEENPSDSDTNPFRYCGEYFDTETETYYLRARYYAPTTGRFTQQDTHWSPANAIYGDNPRKINERQDALGLNTYAYAPEITAIMQSGNLYVYCVNSPILYKDLKGNFAEGGTIYSQNLQNVKFAVTPEMHMKDPNRFVPVQLLTYGIEHGAASVDPKGSQATLFTITMYRKGRMYTLEILYDVSSNTIWHYVYKAG